MRRSPSVSEPTKQSESSGHAPSGTIAVFGAWLECAGTALARCFAERFAVDESASGGSRMREWRLSCYRIRKPNNQTNQTSFRQLYKIGAQS